MRDEVRIVSSWNINFINVSHKESCFYLYKKEINNQILIFRWYWHKKFSEQTCEISYESQARVARDEQRKNACMKTERRIKIQWPTATENIVERKEVTIVSIQGWPIERPRASCVAVARRKRTRRGRRTRAKERDLLSQRTPVTEC